MTAAFGVLAWPEPLDAVVGRLGFKGPILRVPRDDHEAWLLTASDADGALFHCGERQGVELLWFDGVMPKARLRRWLRRLVAREPLRRFLVAVGPPDGAALLACVRPGKRGETCLRDLDEALWADLHGLAPKSREHLAHRLADVVGREGLTQRFFRLFRRHLLALEGAWLDGTQPLGEQLDRYERRDLTLTLLCRLLFVTFLARDRGLGGQRDYLRWLIEQPRNGGLYDTALRPLFFSALNRPAEARPPEAEIVGGVPYLNGGLFSPIGVERRLPHLTLPDEPVAEALHELFQGFTFTAREAGGVNRPHIDPEMLGQVFEALMLADERRRSGSFYTPSALVREVTRELLVGLVGECGAGPRAWASTVLEAEPGATLPRPGKSWVMAVNRRLEAVRILDPAVGSGALLLGILDGLTTLRLALGAPSEYRVRRRLIGQNLYGVDRKAGAVRLCELRMWLSLVASLPQDAPLEPLPNLDHHFRQGDSLTAPRLGSRGWELAPEEAGFDAPDGYVDLHGQAKERAAAERRESECERLRGVLRERLARLDAAERAERALPGELFAEHSSVEAATSTPSLSVERDQAERALRDLERGELPHFSFAAAFPEVAAASGFDAVVGNPPWVRIHDLVPSRRQLLRQRYAFCRSGGSGFVQQVDLSVPFVERALELVRPGGLVGLLLPAKLFKAQYARALRQSLASEHTLEHVRDLGGAKGAGFSASNYPAWLRFRRGRHATGEAVKLTHTRSDGAVIVSHAPSPALSAHERGGPWSPLPREALAAVARMAVGNLSMAEYGLHAHLGIKTGCNEVFLARRWQSEGDGRIVLRMACGTVLEVPEEWAPIAVRGRSIRPFSIEGTDRLLLLYDRRLGEPRRDVPDRLREYFGRHARRLAGRSDVSERQAPWTVFRTAALAARPHVVWRDIATRLEAVALPAASASVPLNTAYCFAVADEHEAGVVTALLNSAPLRAFAASAAEPAMNGHLRFLAWTVERLPWPARLRPGSADYEALARLGSGPTRLDASERQHRIDRIVARLFSLDSADEGALRDIAEAV